MGEESILMILDGVDELRKFIQEHGIPDQIVEEVPLPEGLTFVTRAVRIPVIWNITTGEEKCLDYTQTVA